MGKRTEEVQKMTKLCEICEDIVTKTVRGTKCGHLIYLCETCKVACSTALRVCVRCEDKGL